jgi:transcriptional regulator with XRE-family HTH domain
MVARNTLLLSPPYAVESALKKLGSDLKTARIRRRLTIEEVAKKIGTGVRAVVDAEKGKPSSSMAVYAALLWTYNLVNGLENLADPLEDNEGQLLASSREKIRVRKPKGLDNDF